jgi:hypothetical protein
VSWIEGQRQAQTRIDGYRFSEFESPLPSYKKGAIENIKGLFGPIGEPFLSCLVYPRKPLVNCKTYIMLQHGTDQDQTESTHYTGFKVSALAAWEF